MKKTCKQCKKEYEAERITSQFCSPNCRVAHSRGLSVTDDSVTDDLKAIAPLKKTSISLEEICTVEEIRDFPAMCQTRREQAEAVYILENNDLELLKIHRVSIPNWRFKGDKYPKW